MVPSKPRFKLKDSRSGGCAVTDGVPEGEAAVPGVPSAKPKWSTWEDSSSPFPMKLEELLCDSRGGNWSDGCARSPFLPLRKRDAAGAILRQMLLVLALT